MGDVRDGPMAAERMEFELFDRLEDLVREVSSFYEDIEKGSIKWPERALNFWL
jgi:hypothetical protein